jgi:hypothetical protein
MLGLIAVLLGAFYVKQGIEQAEMKRAVQVAHHQKNANRLLRALDNMPPQYSNTVLQQFTLEEVQRELGNILQIAPKNGTVRRELTVIQERLSQLAQAGGSSAAEAVDIKTLEEANSIRTCAQTLLKYVHQRYQANLLSKDIAQQLSNHLKKVIAQTALDLYLFKAKSFENERKYQLAIPFYQRASQELVKHPYIEKHQELVIMVKEKLKLMLKLDQQQRDEEAANDHPTLDDGVDNLLQEEDEKWKKKYF